MIRLYIFIKSLIIKSLIIFKLDELPAVRPYTQLAALHAVRPYPQLRCLTRPQSLTRSSAALLARRALPVRSTLPAALLPFLTTPQGVLNYSKLLSTARKRSLTSSSSPTTMPSSEKSRTSLSVPAGRSSPTV